MRVISGYLKGKLLKTPKGYHIRPTSDKVKEALFSIVNPHIPESTILDLFSGTGNLGIEALSRGAKEVYFVDNNRKSVQIIKENINSADLISKSTVLFCDFKKAIQKLVYLDKKIDIIFMDPPYNKDFILPCIDSISKSNILKQQGLLIIEHDRADDLPEYIGVFNKIKERKYGNTLITIYAKEEQNGDSFIPRDI